MTKLYEKNTLLLWIWKWFKTRFMEGTSGDKGLLCERWSDVANSLYYDMIVIVLGQTWNKWGILRQTSKREWGMSVLSSIVVYIYSKSLHLVTLSLAKFTFGCRVAMDHRVYTLWFEFKLGGPLGAARWTRRLPGDVRTQCESPLQPHCLWYPLFC